MNKVTRNIILLIMVLVAVFSMTACGTTSASDAVRNNLKQLKTADVSKMDITPFGDAELENNKDVSGKYGDFMKKVQDFSFKVTGEKVNKDGNEARVTVKIRTYEFGKAYTKTYEQVRQDGRNGTIGSKDNAKSYVAAAFLDQANALDKKTYSETVTISCYKNKKGQWKTDLVTNGDFQKAILGGLREAISDSSMQ